MMHHRVLDGVLRWWAVTSFVAWVALLAAVIGFASASTASAATIGDVPATGGSSDAPRLQQRRSEPQTTVKEIEPTVMCPSCDSTLDQSDSPAAERMRAWIAAAVAAGWTADEIRDGLVKEYDGDESILAVPRSGSVGVGAWLAPVLIILAIVLVAIVVPRRWRRDGRRQSSSSSSSESAMSDQSSSPSSPSPPSSPM